MYNNILNANGEISNKTNTKLELKNLNIINNIQEINNDISSNYSKQQNILINNNVINNTNINKYNDYVINNLSYNDALKYDKRSYSQYYFSLLKMKQIIIFTFYTKSDYNSRIIKIILFIFSFALYFTVNALFFNDSTMHKIYEDEGDFNFIYQIPQILYSTLITSFINIVVKFLSLTEKNIIDLKMKKTI